MIVRHKNKDKDKKKKTYIYIKSSKLWIREDKKCPLLRKYWMYIQAQKKASLMSSQQRVSKYGKRLNGVYK